jgi:HTH-type transcriptional regulator, sugar sensing transcriptional regulator
MIHAKTYSSSLEFDIIGNLEEFGLSKYEARAYITLVEKGTLGASEIAYYSHLPRTKIYTTLKKLEKKGLSTITERKPLTASAVPPEEGFMEIMKLHEKRLKNMKGIVLALKRIENDGRRSSNMEEKKYIILDPIFAEEKIRDLIQDARSSINVMVDSWGLNVVSRCKEDLLSAIKRGIKVRLLIGFQCADNPNIHSIPSGLEIRLHQIHDNILTIDTSKVVTIDGTNGKAAVLNSLDIFASSHIRLFEEKWEGAIKVGNLCDLETGILVNALRLTRILEDKVATQIFDHVARPDSDLAPIVNAIEHAGIRIMQYSINELIRLIDYAMRLFYEGDLRYDIMYNMLVLRSESSEKSLIPWALVIMSYLNKIGNEAKMICDPEKVIGNRVHLKLSNPISNSE